MAGASNAQRAQIVAERENVGRAETILVLADGLVGGVEEGVRVRLIHCPHWQTPVKRLEDKLFPLAQHIGLEVGEEIAHAGPDPVERSRLVTRHLVCKGRRGV